MNKTTSWRAMVRLGLLAGLFAVLPAAGPASDEQRIQPAPSGDPVKIAADALSSAKNSCGTVAKAKRFKDGVVEALCSSGARFLVFTMKGETMTKRCLPARALGIHGC